MAMKYSEKIPQFLPGWHEATHDGLPITGKLKDRITIEYALKKESDIIIVSHHYLHRTRPFSSLAYWIMLDGHRVGVVQYALPRINPGYKYHGYEASKMIELSRMWIDPAVQGGKTEASDGSLHCNSIASCAIAKSIKAVRLDWAGKYAEYPIIEAIVSWADDVHHEGTIYRAANFKEYGKAGGHMPGSKAGRVQVQHQDYLHIKSTFIYGYKKPLQKQAIEKARLKWTVQRTNWYNDYMRKLSRQPTEQPPYELTPLF